MLLLVVLLATSSRDKAQVCSSGHWRQAMLRQVRRVVELGQMARPAVTQHGDDCGAPAQGACDLDGADAIYRSRAVQEVGC